MAQAHYTVLGAGGFIGSRLVKALKASGASCYAPVRGDESIFSRNLGHVFYCIGLTSDYRDRPFDTIEAHVTLLARILERASFDRLVYLSSTRLYDGLHGDYSVEKADLPINSANPRHLYDLSKALGENLCLTASKDRACVARLSSVYDVADEKAGFLPALLQRLLKERTFAIDSGSGVVRDYIYIDDVIKSLRTLADSDKCEIVNVASGENVSNQDIVDTLNSCGCRVSLQRQTEREARPLCDITRLRALGINPVPVRSYLENFLKKSVVHGTG